MTYSAPRQGLFAIILLVSFCLQTLLLVISTEQQLAETRTQKGEQMVAQLIDEANLALQNRDRVSLSVIANRYTSEQDVARLIIEDNNNQVLVPIGNAPLQQGTTIYQEATNGDAVIGSVTLTLKNSSKGEIIASLWPFVVGSFILHIFLWLLYGYVARPTKAQLNALSQEIHEHYRSIYASAPARYRQQAATQVDTNLDDSQHSADKAISEPATKSWIADNAHKAVVAAQKAGTKLTQTDLSDATDLTDSTDTKVSPASVQAHKNDANDQAYNSAVGSATKGIQQKLNAYLKSQQAQAATTEQNGQAGKNDSDDLNNSFIDIVDVQISYDDDYRLLDKLAPETADPYFMLCTQLLEQAINELVKQPVLHGIELINQPKFDHSGALVVLKAQTSYSNVALAGVMLGKLYLMLNQIIYDKHRELSRFALPVKIGVSDDAQVRPMQQLLESIGEQNGLLILLPKNGLRQVGKYVQVRSLKRPTTVYERECAFFDGSNQSTMQRLIDMRNAVLLSGNE